MIGLKLHWVCDEMGNPIKQGITGRATLSRSCDAAQSAVALRLSQPSVCDLQVNLGGVHNLPEEESKGKRKWAVKFGLSSLMSYISG